MPRSRFSKSFTIIDASCLICLLHLTDSLPEIDFLQALSLRYQVVYIPRYVQEEVRRKGRIKHRIQEIIQHHPILKICNVESEYDAQLLYDRSRNPLAPIDRGEAEVITQARERRIFEVLIDDKYGRKKANELNLIVAGTVGLLIEFKRLGIVETIKPLIEMLRKARKLHLKEGLFKSVLKQEGEDF
jgi:predicted nucleic acid-binding protein